MSKEVVKELTEYDAYKQINDLFGGDVTHPEAIGNVDIIPTGSPSLDFSIGVGGWPRGRLIHLAGKESSGKTLLSLLAIARWQAMHPDNCAAFLDAEFTYDPTWSAGLGVDNNRLFLVKSNDAAALFTGLVGRTKTNKVTNKTTKIAGLFDMIRDKQKLTYQHPISKEELTLDCGRMGVVVLDSIAAIQTPTEKNAEVGKQNMALTARFLSVELKKLTPGIAYSNVAMFGINQVRDDIGAMGGFGTPESSPGGRALKHACSLMIQVKPRGGEGDVLLDADKVKIGHRVQAKVTKNKVSRPFRVAEYFINFNTGMINLGDELLDLGVKLNFFEKVNARTHIIGEETCTSRAQAIELLESDLEKYQEGLRSHYLKDPSLKIAAFSEEVPENPFEVDDSLGEE